MALLNGMYIYVENEAVTREIETAAHPVETGIDITDHVKRRPVEISLSGELVGENAGNALSQIAQMNQKGAVITYVGRNYFKNGQIIDFKTGHAYNIWGGCSFDMTIREVRFAKSAYDPNAGAGDGAAARQTANRPVQGTQDAGMQQRTHESTAGTTAHTTKNGDTAWSIAKEYGMSVALVREALEAEAAAEKGTDYVPAGTQIALGTERRR